MFGTGNAWATKCYNTCFAIRTEKTMLMVDAGGGNGIFIQLEKAGISVADVHHIYITHSHTDHIIGVLWMLRMYIQYSLKGSADGELHIYGHDKSLLVIRTMADLMLPQKLRSLIGKVVILHELQSGDSFAIDDIEITCFDILSTKEKQFGFSAKLPNGKRLCCLGDEPYNTANEVYAHGADWLLAESFCLYGDRDVFKPYEKNHVTVKDVAIQAQGLGVRNLVLYHTEDKNLENRKTLYTAEAREYYSGNVFVPDDIEEIVL